MPAGPVGSRMPSERDRADIAHALALLAAIGPFDIGQAAVVAGNHVLAVEAAEGTDAMLGAHRRVARTRPHRGAGRHRRAGEGAEAAAGSPLRSAGDRAAHGRGGRACRTRRDRGRRGRGDHRRAGRGRDRGRRGEDFRCRDRSRLGPSRNGAAQAASGRGGGIRRCARRRADGGAARAASFRFVRGRRRPGHGGAEGLGSPFDIADLSIIGLCIDPAEAAAHPAAHPRDRRRRHRRATGCADHHRQPGLHPSGRAPRAQGGAAHSDHQLCAADGVGMAAVARARDAPLCRRGAGDPAVRAGGLRAARWPALHLCGPSAGRAHRRRCARTPRKRNAACPIRRWCWCCPAAGAARSAA